ncbi:MAG: hypothetical protein ACFFB5_19115 [Promethearchaeota archaeon]
MQLYLGVVPGIFPWSIEPSIHKKMIRNHSGIIFSYWSFRKKEIDMVSKGLHDYFSFEGPIMVDSGAYSAFNSGVNIQVEDYASFLSEINIHDKDIIVNLDVIGNSRKSRQNWIYLTKKFDYDIIPVIHIPDTRNSYPSNDYVGLGGMVPSFKINQPGSVHDVASWLASLSCVIPEKKFHGFGVGSPFHQIAFQDFLYSGDWIGWRRNAAVCSCYTPEGSVYVHEARKKKKKGKNMAYLFELYAPPFIDSYEMLHKAGTEGWINRALWNVWWFLMAEKYRDQIKTSRYVLSLQKRIFQTQLEFKHRELDQSFQNNTKQNDNLP